MMLSATAATTVTNVADVARAVLEPWAGEVTFDLTATVTCVIPCESKISFVTISDRSGAVFMTVPDSACHSSYSRGDLVRIVGSTWEQPHAGSLADCRSLEVLAHGRPPAPPRVSLADILRGRYDWQFVRVSGIVREILLSETNDNWVLLTLIADGQVLHVSAPLNVTAKADFDRLLGESIEAIGFCNPRDVSPRAYLGRIFQCPGRDALRMTAKGPADPFDVPAIVSLRYLSAAEVAASGRVRACGHVLAVWDGRKALVRTTDGQVLRAVFDGSSPVRGDAIEISGFPETDCFNLKLAHARFRPTQLPPAAREPVAAVTAADILTGQGHPPPAKTVFHGRTVRLRAKVRELPDTALRRNMMLVEDDTTIFPVDVSAAADGLAGLVRDATVELTGVCVLATDEWDPSRAFPRIRGFKLVVSGPEGIRLVARPPWWTTGRLMSVIGALLAVLVGIFIWNAALRRTATRKGRELLREQLGHVKADLKTEERTRLAVELHDTLAQNLTGVSMEIEAANSLSGNAPPEMLAHIDIAAKALKSCRDELRNCLWDLRSQALEEPDMNTAILRTLQPHVSDSRVTVRFNVPRSKISDNTAHALLRVIRELVTNAIRHGNATDIKVAGSLDADALRCSVTDNGDGFDPETAPGVLQGHFGIQGVRERIEELGGMIDLESTPGRGAKATIAIPIPQEA